MSPPPAGAAAATASATSVDTLLARLRTVEGDIHALQRTIGNSDGCGHCGDVLIQLATARMELIAMGLELVVCDLRQSVTDDDLASGPAAASEALTAIQAIAHVP